MHFSVDGNNKKYEFLLNSHASKTSLLYFAAKKFFLDLNLMRLKIGLNLLTPVFSAPLALEKQKSQLLEKTS
jgi:hypothetical protein